MAYNYNLRLFKSRISGNLGTDKKSEISRRRDSITKYECVTGEWVFEQYIKQNGFCANPFCNTKLNNIFEEEEIKGCWKVTSVNRINNSIGHIKQNCNLMHWYCNCNLQENTKIFTPCYLFKCNKEKCECNNEYTKIFKKINHPEIIDHNKKRMFEIRKGWIIYEYRRRRRKYFNSEEQINILEKKYWRIMRQLRKIVREKKALKIENQKKEKAISILKKKIPLLGSLAIFKSTI